MKKTILLIIIILNFFIASPGHTQGLSRANGVGMKLGFWNITDHPTRIHISDFGDNTDVDIGGIGVGFYFFSRFYYDWYMEFNLGIISGVHHRYVGLDETETDVTAIIPLLFGLRCDLLSTRFPSKMQPYLSVGGGPYWAPSVKGDFGEYDDENQGFDAEQEIKSKLMFGAYAGGGVNIVLASWIALNFDLKYHFVDFKFEEDFSGLEFGLGFSLMWGSTRELFKIEEIRPVISDIYPAYYYFYNTLPLVYVRVKNVAGHTIEINVKSRIKNYSDNFRNSGFVKIARGKSKDIPVKAVFGSQILQVTDNKPAELDIRIEARAGKLVTKDLSAQITVHSINAWNGEMDKLNFFVSSDNYDVLEISRSIVNPLDIDPTDRLANFKKAKTIFNYLTDKGIKYHTDPLVLYYQDDRVQFALETIKLGGGDCDDLVVLYASLLESLGIKTAFVEVKDPAKSIAHLYLLFDTGIEEEQGDIVSTNPKKYVARESNPNIKTVWIPVETTLIEYGFDDAWKEGATAYYKECIIRNGIIDGWVQIFDLK